MRESKDRVIALLEQLDRKGVRLSYAHGELRYQGPKGALTPDDIERIRLSKEEIVFVCKNTAHRLTAGRSSSKRVPLAFGQLAHWRVYDLEHRSSACQVASATKLIGRLHLDVLKETLARVVERHDALRTRIAIREGVVSQEIEDSVEASLVVGDLRATSEELRHIEVLRVIESSMLEPVDLTVGPLWRARLLRVSEEEHVLVLAMEHIISDALSRDIFVRDILESYAAGGRTFSLPEIAVQFSDYAAWQNGGQRQKIERRAEYWSTRLVGCRRLRFPDSAASGAAEESGWGSVALRIGSSIKQQLQEWHRRRLTTLPLAIFGAYVGLVLRWCNASEAVFQYQSNGRTNAQVQNTIGYFASALYLRMELRPDDTFADLAERATKEYCAAYEHSDLGYIAAQVPTPGFTRNTLFNWVSTGSVTDCRALSRLRNELTSSPVSFTNPTLSKLSLDHEPVVLLSDLGDEVRGYIHFPRNRFSVEEMEKLAKNLIGFVITLLRLPQQRVKQIRLV